MLKIANSQTQAYKRFASSLMQLFHNEMTILELKTTAERIINNEPEMLETRRCTETLRDFHSDRRVAVCELLEALLAEYEGKFVTFDDIERAGHQFEITIVQIENQYFYSYIPGSYSLYMHKPIAIFNDLSWIHSRHVIRANAENKCRYKDTMESYPVI